MFPKKFKIVKTLQQNVSNGGSEGDSRGNGGGCDVDYDVGVSDAGGVISGGDGGSGNCAGGGDVAGGDSGSCGGGSVHGGSGDGGGGDYGDDCCNDVGSGGCVGAYDNIKKYVGMFILF